MVALLCARCGVLQCVVVRFSLLQCVTACCVLTQCVRGDVRAACSWLQSVALCCSLLQSAAVQRSVLQVRYAQHVAGGSVLQYVACAAVWCSLLHSNAVSERCATHTILLVALCCSLLLQPVAFSAQECTNRTVAEHVCSKMGRAAARPNVPKQPRVIRAGPHLGKNICTPNTGGLSRFLSISGAYL